MSELQTKELDKLIRLLKDDHLKVLVGVLGKKASRTNKGSKSSTNNAFIGAIHEYGTSTLPSRSFLRMPISTRLKKELEGSENFNPNVAKKVLREGNTRAWLEILGALAHGIVLDAFATGGFGEWKPSKMKGKKNHQTLVETQQLRDSIWYEVR